MTTEYTTTVSYYDLLADIDRILTFKMFNKRDDFNCPIVNFPHLNSNIPVKPAYGVYVSQLIRYFLACIYYNDFLYRHQFLVQKLISQGYHKKCTKPCFIKFCCNTNIEDTYNRNEILWSRKEYIIIL